LKEGLSGVRWEIEIEKWYAAINIRIKREGECVASLKVSEKSVEKVVATLVNEYCKVGGVIAKRIAKIAVKQKKFLFLVPIVSSSVDGLPTGAQGGGG